MKLIREAIAALEPWYDWGTMSWERLDRRGDDDGGRRFELEWFGLKLLLVVGRVPAIDDTNLD